jgi:hypothetical protein
MIAVIAWLILASESRTAVVANRLAVALKALSPSIGAFAQFQPESHVKRFDAGYLIDFRSGVVRYDPAPGQSADVKVPRVVPVFQPGGFTLLMSIVPTTPRKLPAAKLWRVSGCTIWFFADGPGSPPVVSAVEKLLASEQEKSAKSAA